MASLKELRVKAKVHGLKIVTIPKKQVETSIKEGHRRIHRYRVNGWHCTSVQDLAKSISRIIREKKYSEMYRKLNGHRLKYGYKTVPRKSRKK